MCDDGVLETIRASRLLAIFVLVGLVVVSLWAIATAGVGAWWLAASFVVFGSAVWVFGARPKVLVCRDGLLVVFPIGSRWIDWTDVAAFRLGDHPTWGMLGYVDLTSGQSVPIHVAVTSRLKENAGFNSASIRIHRLNELFEEHGHGFTGD